MRICNRFQGQNTGEGVEGINKNKHYARGRGVLPLKKCGFPSGHKLTKA